MSPRSVWLLIFLVALSLVGLALWFWPGPGRPPAAGSADEPGLEWVPAEAVAVASVHVEEVRQQNWLVELMNRVAPAEEEADYREFVEATQFDYARDLDRLWLGVLPGASRGEWVAVAVGRFDGQRIESYALRQGGQKVSVGGTTAIVSASGENRPRVALVFLDSERVALAESVSGLEKVLACVRKAAPSVVSEEIRRVRLERFAAGLNAWAMSEDVARWPPGLNAQPEIAAQLQWVAAGARATAGGIELIAEGETRDPGQAGKLRVVLETYALAGRALLSLKDDPVSKALGEILGATSLEQRGNSLAVRATISREALAGLLTVQASGSPPEAGKQKTENRK